MLILGSNPVSSSVSHTALAFGIIFPRLWAQITASTEKTPQSDRWFQRFAPAAVIVTHLGIPHGFHAAIHPCVKRRQSGYDMRALSRKGLSEETMVLRDQAQLSGLALSAGSVAMASPNNWAGTSWTCGASLVSPSTSAYGH